MFHSAKRIGLVVTVALLGGGLGARAFADAWYGKHALSSAEYQTSFDDLSGKGLRLEQVSGYVEGGALKYAALWRKPATPGPQWAARHGLSAADYQKTFDEMKHNGYRLVYVNGFEVDGQDRYAAIWDKSPAPLGWEAKHGLTSAQYQGAVDDLSKRGYRVTHVSGYTKGGAARFAAIFEKGPGPAWLAKHDLSSDAYQAAFTENVKQGYRLKVVSGYHTNGADRYAALWEKVSSPYWMARHSTEAKFYQDQFENFRHQGYVLAYVNFFQSGSSAKANTVWENTTFKGADLELIAAKAKAYLSDTGVPGVSIALAKDGRLVFAAGFGVADKSTGERVGPRSRFRIASVSKPMTSIAMMHLVEKTPGLLDKKVFGSTGLLGSKYPTPTKYPKLNDIKVRHLLQHVAGFSAVPGVGDPMFQHTDYDVDKLIKWALDNGVQVREPGKMYEYSNFGFCLLGRIIEVLGQKSYEAYVKDVVFGPAGANRMELGNNTVSGRKADEVVYYPDSAYSLNVRRFDAHGGWIATPKDLLRVMVRADGLATKADQITAASYTTMTTKAGIMDKDGKDPWYALGWGVGGNVQSHNGAMAGTIGILVRASGGWTYAGLANTRPDADQWAGKLQKLLSDIAAQVSAWPSYDLF